MKNLFLFVIFLFIGQSAIAQSGFTNYKAIISDNDGNILSNQTIDVRFTVLHLSTEVFQETHSTTTDDAGLIVLNIGEENPTPWFAIQWKELGFSLKTEYDIGSGFVDMGTQDFRFVPYAQHAQTSEISSSTNHVDYSNITNIPADIADGDDVNDADNDPSNELQTLSVSGTTLTISDGNFVTLPTGSGGDQWGTQIVETDATLTGDGTIGNLLQVNGDLTDNQDLSLSGNVLSITDGMSATFTGWDTNAADDFSGSYGDLTGTPTNVSEFANDAGYLTTGTLPNQSDADFYEVGTTTPADDIDDGIFHEGRMAVGKNTLNDGLQNKNAQFEIYSSGSQSSALLYLNEENNIGAGLQSGIFMENEYNGTFGFIAIRNRINGTGTGYVKGLYQNISGNTEGGHIGIFNQLQGTGTAGDKIGVYNSLSAGGDEIIGTKTRITSYTNGLHFGNYNEINNSGEGNHFGMYNTIEGAGIGEQYGVVNTISNSGNNSHFGTVNDLSGAGSGEHKGIYNYLTGDGTGIQYGSYTNIDNTKDQEHYGAYNLLTGEGSGGHTGVKNDLSGDGTGILGGISNNISGSAATMQYGVTNNISGTSTSEQYGTINQINNSGNNIHYGTYNLLNGSGSGIHYATYNWLTGSGTGEKYGVFNLMEGNSTGYGVFNDITNTSTGIYNKLHDYSGTGGTVAIETENTNSNSGDNYGITNKLFGSGAGKLVGAFNTIDNSNASTTSDHIGTLNWIQSHSDNKHYGTKNEITTSGTGEKYGNYNSLIGYGSGSSVGSYNYLERLSTGSGIQIGTHNKIVGSSTSKKYGVYNEIEASGSNDHIGVHNKITGTNPGDWYGSYNLLQGSGSGAKIGVMSVITAGSGGQHFAIYGNAQKSGSYAGYFLGDNYIEGNLAVLKNSTGSTGHINLTETQANDGARIMFQNIYETTNMWTLWGRADNTEADNYFNIHNTTVGNILVARGNGKVGIMRDPATNTFEVNGNASKSTAGSWLANSDRRLKTNIKTINQKTALEKILSLRGVTYEWNDDKTGSVRPTGIQYGFIAQELMEVFPSKVSKDNLGYYQTAYGDYDPLFVQGFKELNNEITELKSVVEKQQQMIEKLLEKIESQNKQ